MSAVAKSPLERPERIYVSRRLASGRKFINENEVIEFLARLGFITIDGELLSVAEKISLFSSAKVVVGICGAGLTNLAFCQPGTKVIEILLPHMHLPGYCHYYWLCSYLGSNISYSKQNLVWNHLTCVNFFTMANIPKKQFLILNHSRLC